MLPASSSSPVLAALAVAALLAAGGCAVQLTSDVCDKPRSFLTADTKVVMAPLAGLPPGSPDAARVGGLIQAATAASGGDYDSVKVIRLVARGSEDPSCAPERIRLTWSGCTGNSPVLIGGEPVTLVWSNAHHAKDDLYVQLGLSNWIIDGSYDVTLELRSAGKTYAFGARVPIEDVSFVPRRIPARELQEMGETFGCTLYRAPSMVAPSQPLASCGNAFDGEVVDRAREGERPWYKVVLRDGGGEGWMPAPPMTRVTDVFPEFGLVGMAVAYQQFLKTFDLEPLRQRNHRAINRAFDDYRAMKVNDDNRHALGVAEVIIGAADLLHGADRRNEGLLKTAGSHFATASQYLPYQSDAANLYLLAQLLACCGRQVERVSINTIEASGTLPPRPQLESLALQMKAFLVRDPANTATLRNLIGLLEAMRDLGYARFGDNDTRAELEALLPVWAARRPSAVRSWTCEALTSRQKQALSGGS
jgi:hypothetical protein